MNGGREKERRGERGGGREGEREKGREGEGGREREREKERERERERERDQYIIKFYLLSSLQESGTLSMPTSTMTVISQPLLLVQHAMKITKMATVVSGPNPPIMTIITDV